MVFFFPGQGSQFVGMGKELAEKFTVATEIFTQANDILGIDLKTICFNGSEELLTDTKNAQPAILTYQYIILQLLKEKNIVPTAVAGHSMGEFSAILASEMLDFSSALKLVRKRGELMADSDPEHVGSMAVVLGLDDQTVIDLCQEVSQEFYVEPVNFNTSGQIVISGLKQGVVKASELALDKGAKRILPLAVSGAFHSQLMNDASKEFSSYVDILTFNPPKCPIVSNVNALFYDETNVKQLLPLQMRSPVQWVKSVEFLVSQGFHQGIEVSQGSIISGMVRKIDKNFTFEKIDSFIES